MDPFREGQPIWVEQTIGFDTGVVYPIRLVVLQSFQTALPGQPARYGLDGWRAALAEPALRTSLLNTLRVTVVRQLSITQIRIASHPAS